MSAMTELVEEIVEAMLKENTGAHILDSGDLYGRWWQRNQGRNFREEPEVFVKIEDDGFVNLTFNTYHYLRRYLERDSFSVWLEKRLYEYADLPENEGMSWWQIIDSFAEILRDEGWATQSFNTYNFDNFLEQVLQGIVISREDEDDVVYVILQIHNGCDVRGGYTVPRVFRVVQDCGDFLLNMSSAWGACNCTEASTDDCYTWQWWSRNYSDGKDSDGEGKPGHWVVVVEGGEKRLKCERCGAEVKFNML